MNGEFKKEQKKPGSGACFLITISFTQSDVNDHYKEMFLFHCGTKQLWILVSLHKFTLKLFHIKQHRVTSTVSLSQWMWIRVIKRNEKAPPDHKRATARVTAIWPLKQKSNVPLNNRHVVNNSASIRVRLREGFLIFMWHDSQDRNSCSHWAQRYSYCEALQCFVIHSLGFRPSDDISRPTPSISSKIYNSRGFVQKFWTDVWQILRNISSNSCEFTPQNNSHTKRSQPFLLSTVNGETHSCVCSINHEW